MRLTDIVVKEAIITDVQADSKEAAIRQMVSGLKTAGKIKASDEEAILGAILKREELGSTGIGWGCAVPHTKNPSVENILVNVPLHQGALNFDSLAGGDLFILFLVGVLLVTEGAHLAHLKLFGFAIEAMSKSSFYLVIFVLVVTDIISTN